MPPLDTARRENALKAFDQAGRLNLDDPTSWTNLGYSLRNLGLDREARQALEKAGKSEGVIGWIKKLANLVGFTRETSQESPDREPSRTAGSPDRKHEEVRELLTNRMSLTECEAKYGDRQHALNELKKHLTDDAEIWEYDSGPNSWQNLSGEMGIALVRNGEVVWLEILEEN